MRIVVVGGHGWKRPGERDPGAIGPAGGEADWTCDLARRVVDHLRALGCEEVEDICLGPNSDRAEYADDVHADLVVYLHGDTGEPRIYSYPGSARGLAAATAIAQGLAWAELPWPVRRAETSAATVERAHGLLAMTKAPAVLVELVDQRDGLAVRWLRDHLDDVARSIAEGVTGGP